MNLSQPAIRWLGLVAAAAAVSASAQTAWFADGFHGGIYGHYPPWVTQFMVDQLNAHPAWRLNLEIEPVTWDFVRTNTPEAYNAFQRLAADQSPAGRIEFVNPAYGQSYLWNISGESIIQQFNYGMRKIREHFPNATFTTYCSEEPCFTSALPGILKSFGFQQAVLKNPDTCWGGYTAPHGGELVNWIGPDGSSIPTVPRYAMESLKPGSTWETIAAVNSPDYIHAALQAGIAHPIGMCLQDAGWRNGPWGGDGRHLYQPIEYTTWKNYFANVALQQSTDDWRLSQEDIRVNLLWGSQVLQRIAQEVRAGENQLVAAEKLATMASVWRRVPWPESTLAPAWESLLLSQHHDCWIVPYNGRPGDTWADKVARWTETTCNTAIAIQLGAMQSFGELTESNSTLAVHVFNTVSVKRSDVVEVRLPASWRGKPIQVCDEAGREVPSQRVGDPETDVVFRASCPSLGYATYRLAQVPPSRVRGATVQRKKNLVRLETDFYKLDIAPARGGIIQSLIAKQLGGRELLQPTNRLAGNGLCGYFFQQSRFHSNMENPATVEELENGPVRLRVKIRSHLGIHPVTQWITLVEGEPRIDFRLKIDWVGNPGIGSAFEQAGGFRNEHDHKAFYEDSPKLSVYFPFALTQPEVYKNAPFDVTHSRLTDTFFDSWSQIKNNVLLNWVDLFDTNQNAGVALMCDHTTSYTLGPDRPLGLTVQYRGAGLWGRDFSIQGPTDLHYAVLPHHGDWQAANLWLAGCSWNEPLANCLLNWNARTATEPHSLVTIEGDHWEVTTLRAERNRVLVRLFNASLDDTPRTVHFHCPATKVDQVQLDGRVVQTLELQKVDGGEKTFKLALPRFGIGTLEITP